MTVPFILIYIGLLTLFIPPTFSYDLVHDYSGLSFFDAWDFYGSWDNLTLGDVWWLNKDEAFSSYLAYINDAGNAILRIDNVQTVVAPYKRNSVRITSQASYDVGSLWVADIVHIPYGCAVWPAFWTMGPKWPDDGEIDIIESINLRTTNQMALHTTPGCFHDAPPNQIGQSIYDDCSLPSGCTVQELQPNNFAEGFASNGGGVYAAQFDISGVYIWFWPRQRVPPSLALADSSMILSMDDFGPPSAAYPNTTCNIPQFFTSQRLVIDITMCGTWAGLPENFLPLCAGSTGLCYEDGVLGPGSRFDQAYFEIKYVRAYTTGGILPIPTAALNAQLADLQHSAQPPAAPPQTTIKPSSAPTHLLPSSIFYPGAALSMANTWSSCSLALLILGALWLQEIVSWASTST
ncbi:glycoside hydrolase family 16 protein [Flagelloscypha sp. PMI_526]|nr:glycoside hydrolase family 16 protein [Flagelloscypha sp. PMI_526]